MRSADVHPFVAVPLQNVQTTPCIGEVEKESRAGGIQRLFVLTTQATHWFKERGFEDARIGDLPVERQELYNYERGSKVLIKKLR